MNRFASLIFAAIAALFLSVSVAQAKCNARFLNPITEVCWDCIFPISVGAMSMSLGSSRPDTDNPNFPLCVCPGVPLPRIGLSIGIWEPARLVDVSNETGCFSNLGFDVDFGLFSRGKTSVNASNGGDNGSKWHAHYYYYPLISMLGTAIDALCLETTAFDLAWMSELDPLWMDAELSTLLNPEALLFANPIAQGACAADCAVASSGNLPLDDATILHALAGDLDGDFNVAYFSATERSCRIGVLGTINCCSDSGWALGSIAECSASEVTLYGAQEAGAAVYLETYCSEQFLFFCAQRSRRYCTFNSRIARIISEQGQRQLYGDFECRAMTQDELEAVDWSEIDFSSAFAEMFEGVGSISPTDLTTQIQENIIVSQPQVVDFYE